MPTRAEDTPLCPEGDFRFWTGIGAGALGVLALGCLAGALPSGPDGLPARLSAAAANAVWVVLCTAAGTAGFMAVAIVRSRPAGALADIASRAFACTAVASLVQFVPVPGALLKAAFDGIAVAAVAGALARPAYRIPSLDAYAAVAVAAGAVGALAGLALLVTWAAAPA